METVKGGWSGAERRMGGERFGVGWCFDDFVDRISLVLAPGYNSERDSNEIKDVFLDKRDRMINRRENTEFSSVIDNQPQLLLHPAEPPPPLDEGMPSTAR
jgi:hypothetical protein